MKRLLILLTALLGFTALYAQIQNRQMLLSNINKIKSQTDIYLWDQFTHPNSDTAKVESAKRLILHIETEIGENSDVTVEEVLKAAKFIPIDRGNLKQFFAYISKENARRIKQSSGALISRGSNQGYETGNVTEQRLTETGDDRKFVADAFTMRIMDAKTFNNAYKLLTYLKSEGIVLQFGKLRDVEDYSSLDLILFDMKSGEIVTLLSGEDVSGQRINLLLGEPDSLSRYPQEMTAVIWYIRN